MAIHVIVALGLNLLVGYTGQISLGHAGFFAIGAYSTLALMQHLGLPFVMALPLGGFISAGFGFFLGLPALQAGRPLPGHRHPGLRPDHHPDIGPPGLFGRPHGPAVAASEHLRLDRGQRRGALRGDHAHLRVPGLGAKRNLTKTRVGRAFVAIRDSDIAAECIGVNLTYYKTLAFAVSAFYTGIGGGLMAFVLGFISPHTFNVMVSIMFLAMVVVGGLGSMLGSVMGAVLITWLQQELARIGELPYLGPLLTELSNQVFTLSGLPNVQYVVFGLIMVLIIIFEPLGLYGFWIRTKIYWRTWPF